MKCGVVRDVRKEEELGGADEEEGGDIASGVFADVAGKRPFQRAAAADRGKDEVRDEGVVAHVVGDEAFGEVARREPARENLGGNEARVDAGGGGGGPDEAGPSRGGDRGFVRFGGPDEAGPSRVAAAWSGGGRRGLGGPRFVAAARVTSHAR